MKALWQLLNRGRRELWRSLSGDPETSWISHAALVVFGTFPPAGLVFGWWGAVAATLTAFALSELWLLFFAGREVVDYFRHTLARDPRPAFVRDGIGDLAGPVLVHLFCWLMLVGLVLKGG
jgi:hypothetical protein